MARLEDHLRGERNIEEDPDTVDEEPPPGVSPPVSDGLPQTGPKGVLTDYYRKMEEDKQAEILATEKRKQLIKQHSATVTAHSEDAAEAAAIVNVAKALEEGSLDKDPFLQQYRAQRREELKKQASAGAKRKWFGNLVEVRGDKYASLIDTSPAGVIVIIHIYTDFYEDCVYLNKRLTRLAKLYPTAKFCRVQCDQLGVTQAFRENALPALMVYRDGKMILNHVRVTDDLGTRYEDEDLEEFLQKNNCLPPQSEKEDTNVSGRITGGANKILGTSSGVKDSDDSDD